jgi:two-component system cell cycle sensor histidine kinase PleC
MYHLMIRASSVNVSVTDTGARSFEEVDSASHCQRPVLSVRDNGSGIPPEEIPIVLSSFGLGSIAIKSAEQGAGLGLPIVQALMTMHDGTFELKSKLREGTEVIAAFPRSRVMEALPPVPEEQRRGARWLRAG